MATDDLFFRTEFVTAESNPESEQFSILTPRIFIPIDRKSDLMIK